jgi:hypothetical protein
MKNREPLTATGQKRTKDFDELERCAGSAIGKQARF